MGHKKKTAGTVILQREIAPQIFDMWIETDLAREAGAGQFAALYPKGESMLLPRPISVCETDRQAGRLRIVYRVQGKGTREFSAYAKGDTVFLSGILGNGFPLMEAEGKRALLAGGGIGIPPLLELAKELRGEKTIVAGYRDKNLFLKEDMEKYAPFYAATEDGSAGTKGNVLDAVRERGIAPEVIYACGPMPMLRAVKEYAAQAKIKAYLSLEERMACGIGACLGCVCKTTKKDGHSHVKNARICTEGPVFEAGEVDI